MKEVYMCSTPYHVILSCAIASDSKSDAIKKELIITQSFPYVDKLISAIKKWRQNPFDEIITTQGSYDVKLRTSSPFNVFKSVYVFKREVNKLKKRYSNDDIKYSYVFNDSKVLSQYLAYLTNKKGGSSVYVEDGAAPYTEHSLPNPRFGSLVMLLYKLILGRWCTRTRYHGQYRYINRYMVLRPKHVRSELKNKPIEPIKVEDIINLNESGLTKSITNQFDVEIPQKSNSSVLVLPHSDFLINHRLLNKYKNEIIPFILDRQNILVKYHPREKNHYLKNAIGSEELLSQSVPMEIIFLHLINNPPKYVIGDISTALLTSKFLLEDTKTISLIRLLNYKNKSLENLFNKIGVSMPESIDEFKQILK